MMWIVWLGSNRPCVELGGAKYRLYLFHSSVYLEKETFSSRNIFIHMMLHLAKCGNKISRSFINKASWENVFLLFFIHHYHFIYWFHFIFSQRCSTKKFHTKYFFSCFGTNKAFTVFISIHESSWNTFRYIARVRDILG